MRTEREVKVYLFTGFLESGKTKFIRETLQDRRFNDGEPTLLLLCEEGEEEYEVNAPYMECVTVETLEDESEFNEANLMRLASKANAKKVIVEYNGMWLLNDFYERIPEDWVIYQEMMFADVNTFENYNANMRSLVYDKLSSAELVIFNRCEKGFDKMPVHKIVRAVSRRIDIAYEYADGLAEYDDIVDPLPFDINADVIKIDDRDYALWYRDTSEEMGKYDGKVVSFKALVAIGKDFSSDTFVGGRRLMSCCADDLIYAGFVCKTKDRGDLKNGDWVNIVGKIEIRFNNLYGRKGPVIHVTKLEKTIAPDEPVATFY